MPDTLLERKDRFVCITRIYPLAGNKSYVLEDIRLINERDTPPSYYTPLIETVDTNAKGTSKRTICVKLVERQAGLKCICDIIFLYRSKRPPQSYTLIGDINGLQMCIKEGMVPPFRVPPPIPVSQLTSNLYPNPMNDRLDYRLDHQYNLGENIYTQTRSKKTDEKEMLEGIPFAINPKYLIQNRQDPHSIIGLDSFRILTNYEVNQFFHYDFSLERTSI